MMADSKGQNTEDLPSEVSSPGEYSASTETSEACSSPPEREESSQETEPEISNQEEREESSQKTERKTSKASETEPELVVESSSLVDPTPETVAPTDTFSAEETESRFINVVVQQFFTFIKENIIWSVFVGFLAVVAGLCFGLAAIFVTCAATLLGSGITVSVTALATCAIRIFRFKRNLQSSGSEQMLLEGGLRQSPDIRAPITEQPSSIHGSSSRFPWPLISTGVRDALRRMFGLLGPRQELGGEQQSRRTRTYVDPPESEGIFERHAGAASGSSIELSERNVASSPSLGQFEGDSSSSGSSNVMVVAAEVHREESSSEDTVVEEKPKTPRCSDDEPEFESSDL